MKKAIYTIAACAIIGCTAASTTLLINSATANPVTPDKVKVTDGEIKASLTSKPGNVEEGKKWFANRKLGNCLACHANQDMTNQPFHGEIGPPVDAVATRYSPSQLRAILVDAKSVFGEQTIMPGFYKTDPGQRTAKKFKGKTILSGQQIEDIIAYLMTLKK